MEQSALPESDVASNLASRLHELIGPNLPGQIVSSVIALIAVYLCVLLSLRLINRHVADINRRHRARKAVVYAATAIALIVLPLIWLEYLTVNWSMILSVTAAGLVIALSDAILSVAAWLFILVRRPYSVGDRIKIGKVTGDVIDIRLFQTTLLEVGEWVSGEQSTFRLAHCPNNVLFREPIWNYTSGFPFIWDELDVTVTFESDWDKARQIMIDRATKGAGEIQQRVESALKQLTKKYPIKYPTLTPMVYVRIVDYGVKLTLRYLTDARRRRTTCDELSRGILQDFDAQADVNFAYPTYRIVKEPDRRGSLSGES
jgi:small-conductance mechanosensitive channel